MLVFVRRLSLRVACSLLVVWRWLVCVVCRSSFVVWRSLFVVRYFACVASCVLCVV